MHAYKNRPYKETATPAYPEDLIKISHYLLPYFSIFPQTCCYQSSIQSSLATLENLIKMTNGKIILDRNWCSTWKMQWAWPTHSCKYPGKKSSSICSCPWMTSTASPWGGTLLLAPLESLSERGAPGGGEQKCTGKAQEAEVRVRPGGRNTVACLGPRLIQTGICFIFRFFLCLCQALLKDSHLEIFIQPLNCSWAYSFCPWDHVLQKKHKTLHTTTQKSSKLYSIVFIMLEFHISN